MLKYSNICSPPPTTYNEVLFKVLYEIALANGSDFFDTVVESISKHLGVKYVLIGEFIEDKFRVKSKSLWVKDSIAEQYEYSLFNTPCEHVIEGEIKIIPQKVQMFYPKDQDLVDWEVESYIGIPLFNHKGGIIGHIAVLDNDFIEDVELVVTVLKTCSNRVGAELERAISDELVQKRTQEKELKTQQLRHTVSVLEATIESTTDGLLIVNTKGEILQFNQKFLQIWNIPPEIFEQDEDNPSVLFDILIPQLLNPQEFISRLREIYSHPESISNDVIYFNDGRIIERYSQPQKIGYEIVGRIWSFRDITQQVMREEKLKKNEFLFRSLFEESPIGIVIDVHPKNKLVKINKKMCRMLGYTPKELAQLTAADITHPDDRKNYLAGFQSVAANKRFDCNFEKRYITKEGKIIWGSVSLSVVREKNGKVKHRVVMIQDISEAKKASLELKQKAIELNEKNEQLQKYIDSNMQLENFAYIASHDLREPLLTTIGLVELLLDTYSDKLNEEAVSFLHFIDQSVKNMEVLINDLLTYSRVNTQAHTISQFNLKERLENIIAELQKTIVENNAKVEFENIPSVFYANETKIVQLLQNLITNAIKFKKVNVPPIVKISAKDLGKCWKFSVTDNGIGIAPEYHNQIFVLFKKLHSKYEYEGTGIGLATCKKIVEQHGGSIWIESELGKGTTFHFIILK